MRPLIVLFVISLAFGCGAGAGSAGSTMITSVTKTIQIMNSCEHCSNSGPICLRMNLEDRTGAEIARCNRKENELSHLEAEADDNSSNEFEVCPRVPFASIVRISSPSPAGNTGRYKVRLIGRSNGVASWVGIAFGRNESAIMRKGTLGIACLLNNPDKSRSVRVVRIQNRSFGNYTDEQLRANTFVNTALDTIGIHHPVVVLDPTSGYLLCEFELDPILWLNGEPLFDLEREDFKIGLAHNHERATIGSLLAPHTSRGSSIDKLNLFRILEPKESGLLHGRSMDLNPDEDKNSAHGGNNNNQWLPLILWTTLLFTILFV